jgi:hypothetical protein
VYLTGEQQDKQREDEDMANKATELPARTTVHTIGQPNRHGVLIRYETSRAGRHAVVQFAGRQYTDMVRASSVRAS